MLDRVGWVRTAMWGLIALILIAPIVAMQFTREVAWTRNDFLFAGALLGGTGLAYELTLRTTRSPGKRLLIGGLLTVGVVVIWAQGAVGIF